ncbi:MAG: cysteine desulfurase [Bacilli bacterium]|nr:cysteine desulfurase [Bacilli bacterium]
MFYFDYCATTPTNKEVLNFFEEVNNKYWFNPNSNYEPSVAGAKLIMDSANKILNILGLKDSTVIFTSGATEANNLALKGYCYANKEKGKHIITSPYEHSSIVATLSALEKEGFEVTIADTNEAGEVDVDKLKTLIRDDTILVSITATSSEVGIINDIESIANLLTNYDNCKFHVDYTQLFGKYKNDLSNVDMLSYSGHKIYGIKGVGALIIKNDINLSPIINGGKSTTKYRAGTPSTELIASLGKASELIYENFEAKEADIKTKSDYLKEKLLGLSDSIKINTPENGLASIINVSILGHKSEEIQQTLAKKDIYVSTQTACSLKLDYSPTIYKLTNDLKRAESSIRVSISYLTTIEEIDYLIKAIGELL